MVRAQFELSYFIILYYGLFYPFLELLETDFELLQLALPQCLRQRLRTLSIDNATIYHSDGFEGLERHAPYDGILVTAAPKEIPQVLLDQLADGGRIVAPVGLDLNQDLKIIDKSENGLVERNAEKVRFVPLVSGKT